MTSEQIYWFYTILEYLKEPTIALLLLPFATAIAIAATYIIIALIKLAANLIGLAMLIALCLIGTPFLLTAFLLILLFKGTEGLAELANKIYQNTNFNFITISRN